MEHAEGRAGCKSSDYWCFRTLSCSTTIMICARVLDISDFGIVLPKIIKFPKCVHNNNELLTFPSALSPYAILGLVFCCNLQNLNGIHTKGSQMKSFTLEKKGKTLINSLRENYNDVDNDENDDCVEVDVDDDIDVNCVDGDDVVDNHQTIRGFLKTCVGIANLLSTHFTAL
ncbi:hypothetical protein GQX74_009994 [Glossina fuscipes]|nr:hypothetical protein GQX74_009994 [Glossina fuscipes]